MANREYKNWGENTNLNVQFCLKGYKIKENVY